MDKPRHPPRGLARTDAAAHLGIGASLFDRLVAEGLLPRAKVLGGRRIWDRMELEAAFEDAPYAGDPVASVDAAITEGNSSWDAILK